MQRSTVVYLFYLSLFCVLSEQNFSITGCQRETAYNVLDNNQSSLTCTGLLPLSNIYWSFTGPSSNGTEIRLGQCYVYNTTSDHNNCTDFDTDFAISRLNKTFTTLRFVSNVENIHGGLIKCSQFDNNTNTQAYCAVRKDNTSAEFHIPECSSGLLEVNENQSVSLTCTGLWLVSNTYWSITDNDAEVSLGNCSLCYHNCSSKPCEVPDRRYTITRSRFDVTTLEFLSDMQSYDGATVKCSQLYSETTVQANCTIRILQGNTTPTTGTNTTTNVTIVAGGTSTFPLALVTGGAGAATLVIIFIIVVAVVVRRSKRKKGPKASEENVPTSGTELDVMSTQNDSDQNNKDGARTSNMLHLTSIVDPSAHNEQLAPQPLTAIVPNESTGPRNSRGSARYTDGYTYVDINDVPAARTSLNADQPSKRVAFQPDALNMKTQPKGDNHNKDDSVENINDPYDRIGNGSSQKDNKGSFQVDDDNACKPIARANTVGPKGDVYSQVNKVRQRKSAAAEQEMTGHSRDQPPKKLTTKDNVNGADDLKDQKGGNGGVYANLDGTSSYDNVIAANTNGEWGTSKGDDADGDIFDDEYNRLQYRRADPQDDPQYSHIARL